MKKTCYCTLLLLLVGALLVPGAAFADPCLMVYPDATTIYHYDPVEYYTVGPGDPLYDPAFDRGGEVLIDVNSDEIALDVYQATGLVGFEADAENQGYYTLDQEFTLIVDGFNNQPTTYANIVIVFDRAEPDGCVPDITIAGDAPQHDMSLGWYYTAGDLAVSTPTPYGNNYSDTLTLDFAWSGCTSLRIWAFADEDHNLQRDGGECFSAYSHDLTVPTQAVSWGTVKALYAD
jgi:hypothetical protein